MRGTCQLDTGLCRLGFCLSSSPHRPQGLAQSRLSVSACPVFPGLGCSLLPKFWAEARALLFFVRDWGGVGGVGGGGR